MDDHVHDVCEVVHLRQNDTQKYLKTNAVLRTIIDGVYDDQSVLSLLNGTPEIVQTIWNNVVASWRMCIKVGKQSYWPTSIKPAYMKLEPFEDSLVHFSHTPLRFPIPSGIQINMMPFVMARTFEESKLPDYLKPYWEAFFEISFREPWGYVVRNLVSSSEIGKIGYLTIDESYVNAGESQRRPGLHTDCPGKVMLCCERESNDCICLGRVISEEKDTIAEQIDSKLGHGYTAVNTVNCAHPSGRTWLIHREEGRELVGGIYMASNVENSCEVWNCMLEADADGTEVIGNLGDIEHLRGLLPGKPEVMRANKLYWITDRTPYESLPMKEGTYRQFFRLVTIEDSLWFEEHSTKNPYGVVPDPDVTMIVKGSKFEDNFALLDLNVQCEWKKDVNRE